MRAEKQQAIDNTAVNEIIGDAGSILIGQTPDRRAWLTTNMPTFANEIVQWQMIHGRRALPWQDTRDPYRVWLSEIMLQQTQVATVLDYYARFLHRFPSVADLAAASQDDVLAHWSGLGYYSRARNLYRCAQDVVNLHAGQFPRCASDLQTLPGIGRSTAAAIASFCFGERVAILDGNVKRVLARVLGFSDDLAKGANERALWNVATQLLPNDNLDRTMPRYTQGLMDLGATICSTRQPMCMVCPVQSMCCGRSSGNPEAYPVKTRNLKRSQLAMSLLLARKPDGSCWLEKRPSTGIWGGLYCLPIFESYAQLQACYSENKQTKLKPLPEFLHVLTHKDLYLSPWRFDVESAQARPTSIPTAVNIGAWYTPAEWAGLGLPAPIRKLLDQQAAC